MPTSSGTPAFDEIFPLRGVYTAEMAGKVAAARAELSALKAEVATLRADMQRLHNERTTLLMPGFTYLKNEELERLRADNATLRNCLREIASGNHGKLDYLGESTAKLLAEHDDYATTWRETGMDVLKEELEAANAENARLRGVVEALEEDSGRLDDMCSDIQSLLHYGEDNGSGELAVLPPEQCVEAAANELKELRSENSRLREVVEAAKRYLAWDGFNDPRTESGVRGLLVEALARISAPAAEARVAGTNARYGRCDCCGEPVNALDSSWRQVGNHWEHRCREANEKCPQVGHIGTAQPAAEKQGESDAG